MAKTKVIIDENKPVEWSGPFCPRCGASMNRDFIPIIKRFSHKPPKSMWTCLRCRKKFEAIEKPDPRAAQIQEAWTRRMSETEEIEEKAAV